MAFLRRADRSRAVARAAAHSRRVRALRVALPIAAAGVASLYVLPQLLTVQIAGGTASVERVDVGSGGLRMVNPRIRGVTDKGSYDVRADDAVQQVKAPELMTLNRINAEFTTQDGGKTVLTAPTGLFHSKLEELTLNDGADISGTAGLTGKFKTAKAYIKEKRIVSEDPVDLRMHDSTIRADRMELFTAEQRAVFTGRVVAHLERRKPDAQ
jgi:lipopolysaccharide export system protein LptC